MISKDSRTMEGKRAPMVSRLFSYNLIEGKDDSEDKYERCYSHLQTIIAGKGDRECNDALVSAVSKDTKSHDEICLGFIVAILTEPDNASKHYKHLTLAAKDGLQHVMAELTKIVADKYLKVKEQVRSQIIWFVKEMIRNCVASIDGVVWMLMRQIVGGDVTQKNLWLADSLMDIFLENKVWLVNYQFLYNSVVYTYLRIIEDHSHPNLKDLRNKEVNFVVALIRDRFNDVLVIGRDLIRLLQNISRIPEIEKLWNEILHNPSNLAHNFTGLVQVMNMRTSRRFLQSRITPDMEKKLVFLTSQVRFGNHKRYQDWFQKTYFSTPESHTLRCDIIRFIVGVIHPPNELLCSDIIPRWAVIGWLLTTCTNQVAASNAKLALFYDWLFYDAEKDNIMNIEPAILVMHHSLRPHPAITSTLLDFLCRILHNFYPAEQEKVKNGIYSSLRQIVDKRVLPALRPLFTNQRLDDELRALLKEKFGVLFNKEEDEKNEPSPVIDREDQYSLNEPGAPAFSDDEEEERADEVKTENSPVVPGGGSTSSSSAMTILESTPPLGSNRLSELSQMLEGTRKPSYHNHIVTNGDSDELDLDIITKLEELREEKNCERRCEIMDQLVQSCITDRVEDEAAQKVAKQLSETLKDHFEGRIFPENPTPENIEDSIGQPLFVLFRNLCEISESDPNRTPVLAIMAELYGLQPRLGYYLLYYLKCYTQPTNTKSKSGLYKDLMLTIDENNSLDICLVNDMRQCQEDDVNLFVWLCPDIYTQFQKAAIGNVDLLYLVVSCVDGYHIQTLLCLIVSREFIMFKKDSVQSVINVSLTWETFEQYALWQLLSGHDLPVDCVLPLIPKLSYDQHAEAISHIMLRLKREKPTAELVKHLMSRDPVTKDRFVTSVLTCWINDYEDKLGDLLGSQLCKQASPAGGKRKRTHTNKSGTSLGALAEMTLSHLDNLRQRVKQYEFFNLRSIQQALQTVFNYCTDGQRMQFSDLFALADSETDEESDQKPNKANKQSSKNNKPSKSPAKQKPKSSGGGGSVRNSESSGGSSDSEPEEPPKKQSKGRSGAKQKQKRAIVTKVSYKEMISSDYSTEDEDNPRNNTPKKRKKVDSDSD